MKKIILQKNKIGDTAIEDISLEDLPHPEFYCSYRAPGESVITADCTKAHNFSTEAEAQAKADELNKTLPPSSVLWTVNITEVVDE